MKILFLYPNQYLDIGIPTGIATLSAVLKREGHEVDIFDWTFIKIKPGEKKALTGNKGLYLPTPYTLEDLVADDPVRSLDEAFEEKLRSFDPNLVAVSVMTGYFDDVIGLLNRIRPSCPVVAGGVHSTISPEDTLVPDVVDFICVGEGEEFLLELCNHLEKNMDYTGIRNIGYKRGKQVKINELRPFIDMDELPDPDWELFDERHLFRPFMGHVYSGSFYVMSRGCPGRCSYCVNGALRKRLRDCGRYFRYQSPDTTARHLANLKKKHGATWFKFVDDSITLLPKTYLEQLADALKPLDIMFGCSVRPETVTRHKVELLKSMGCVAASVGIESGNALIRKEVLKRNMSNEQIENAVHLLQEFGIRVSTFNMIGLPGETRENVFETIRLNKHLGVPTANVYIVYPYPGTELSTNYATRLRDEKGMIIPVSEAAVFKLSKMARHEVEGLLKTFNLYLNLPEEMWQTIRKVEKNNSKDLELKEKLEQYAIGS